MSADHAQRLPSRMLVTDPRARHVLRYAFGATLAMGLAMALAWPISYLVPVLCLPFLASPKPPPSFRESLLFLAALGASLAVALWSIKYLLGSQFVFFTGIGLVLFRVFYAQCSGASPILILWLLLSLLVLPMVAVQSPDLAALVAQSLFVGAAASLFVAWTAHAIIPETREAAAAPAKPELPPAKIRVQQALERMIVVYPLFILFHLFEWLGAVLILVFVGLLSIQPGFAENFKGGIAMILGNTMGGLAAIVGFNLLTVAPRFEFLLGICLFAGLFFGNRLFGGGKAAPLFGMAFSTFLLILGSTTSGEGEAASAVYSRILQITMAVVYVVTAFGLIRRWRETRSG
jgi:hypothetical protein